MRVTIKMIAEKSGVSRGTVDRVIHDRPNVKPEIRDRVKAVIDELNYQPNLTARALAKSNVPTTIGVLIANTAEGIFEKEVRRGLDDARYAIAETGTELDVRFIDGTSLDESGRHLADFMKKGVNALILYGRNSAELIAWVNRFVDKQIPVITINTDLPESNRNCYIGENQYRCGAIASDLMHKFCRNDAEVLVVLGSFKYAGHTARTQGFIETLIETGFPKRRLHVRECHNRYEETYQCVTDFLNRYPGYQGIYMANESVIACADAVRALQREKDTLIVFHDRSDKNDRLMREGILDYCIDQNLYDQAYTAVDILVQHLSLNRPMPEGVHYTATTIYTPASLPQNDEYCSLYVRPATPYFE
ncbi:MAG TPA: substrate-binding domain-containing protein [Clostridiaceae bacterium]|nr:substrate-binding domain-containing protein [Clostridiaceae bacterium]